MYRLIGTAKKFWCLEGIVAIIISIFAIRSLICGSYLSAILMTIFSYWWIRRVIAKPMSHKRYTTNYNNNRDLDL